jgi:tetratricopeptide (TPR) repeat protein
MPPRPTGGSSPGRLSETESPVNQRSNRCIQILLGAALSVALPPGVCGQAPPLAELKPRSQPTKPPRGYTHLTVVGFQPAEGSDPRDTWITVAAQETLAWRLQRTPSLIVIPTVRAHQGRDELREEATEQPEWSRVVRLLGGELYLTGECSGPADSVRLDLRLMRPDGSGTLQDAVTIGPSRLFDALDQATHWVLSRLGVAQLDEPARKLIFAPPCDSPSALEYHAKAITAARADNMRDATYYAAKSVEYDRDYRPALGLLAQIEMQRAPLLPTALHNRTSAAIQARLHALTRLARRAGDTNDLAEAELARGLMLRLSGSFDAALERVESALVISYEAGNPYGQLAAMDSICDLYLSRRLPPGIELADEDRREIRRQDYRHAAEWQRLVLGALHELGDVLAEAPAASRLALIYQDLEEHDAALEMHRRTLAAAQKTGSRRSEATAWMLIGQCYRHQQRWKEALDATSNCLARAPEGSKPRVRVALGSIYQAMEQWQAALGQYESALERFRQDDDLINQLVCLREVAALRIQLGERKQAISTLQEALDIAHALRSPAEETLRKQLEECKSQSP